MRTTLTIDDDLAVLLEKERTDRGVSLKQIVNETLRLGLAQRHRRDESRQAPRTRSVSLGRPLLADVDNVSEALAIAEGDSYP